MQRVSVYIAVLWKRMWKTPGYTILLCLFPLLTAGLYYIGGKDDGKIYAAFYAEEGAFTSALAGKLTGRSEQASGSVGFYRCGSSEEVKRMTASGKADSGYVFPAGLYEKMERGEWGRSVVCYRSKASAAGRVTDEIVFSELFELFEEYSFPQQAARFLEGGEEIKQDAQALFRMYRDEEETFSLAYEEGKTQEQRNADGNKERTAPLRGLAALMMYLSALCGTLNALSDTGGQRFSRIPHAWIITLLTIALPVLVSAGVCAACLYFFGEWQGAGREMGRLAAYQILLAGYGFAIHKLLRREERLAAVMPVFVLSCVIFCPVFYDFSVFIPLFRVLEKLFPVAYYLRW